MLPRARLEVARFRAKRRAALARLERVNRALAAWDEWEAAHAMPAEMRPPVPQSGPLGRTALDELRRVLVEVIAELEAAWGRRD